jgi:hypothetical protein
MPLSSSLGVSLSSTLSNALDLATARVPLAYSKSLDLSSGTGANQADKIFSDTRTLAASATEDLDLAGVLVDALGSTLTFARIKGLLICPAAANTNSLIVGNAASNGFISWVGGATHTVTVRPGGLFALFAPDATAYAVTAATADLLHIANGGAGTSVTYDIVIIGASA